MREVDCMACVANHAMSDVWPWGSGGPRRSYDDTSITHAFVESRYVPHRGWWKCDFRLSRRGAWFRNRAAGFD